MSNQQVVFMFSGQGSQYFQMGWSLYQKHPLFRDCMRRMDVIVRELCGYSVIEVLYDQGYTKAETFDRTLLSHPAIFMVEYATARILMDAGVVPQLTLGTSVGSFAAAAVAGYLNMEDALVAVVRQASMLEARCEKGGMLAVLDRLSLYEDDDVRRDSELASVNLPGHFVISARQDRIQQLEQALRTKGVTLQKLPVAFAFHSSWIDAAAEPFLGFMKSVRSNKAANIPMICAIACEQVTQFSGEYLWRAVREPIRFYDTIMKLEKAGTYRYIDVGPTATLSTFVKHSLDEHSASTTHATLTPFGHDLKNIAGVIESA